MEKLVESRRRFLQTSGMAAGALWLAPERLFGQTETGADYTIRIEASNDMAAVVLIYVARCSLPIRCDQAKISETLTRPPIL